MHQQLWGYKVEEKLYVGVREQKRLSTTALKLVGSVVAWCFTVGSSFGGTRTTV
jgi:hypothetical protein